MTVVGDMGDVLGKAMERPAATPATEQTPAMSPGELLKPTLLRLAGLALPASYLWLILFIGMRHPNPNWAGLAAPALLALSAVLAIAHRQRFALSAAILVGGMCLAATAEIAVGHYGAGQWLILASIIVAGTLLGPVVAASAALALGIVALLLPDSWAQTWGLLSQVAFGTGLTWAAGGNIVAMLAHAEASEERAWRQAEEAIRRRGELQRVHKALRDMYALLERTNHELAIARKEAEEAKEIKARFAANISHELRTPLNLIMGFSRMMYRAPEVYGDVRWTPELRADVREIYRASRHLLGMIDDILDLARIEAQRLPLKLETTDLAELVEEAAATARGLLRRSAVILSTHVPEQLPEVVVDRTRIRQVLLNLLNNAIRFTDSGEIRITVKVRNGEVEVAVSDTGVGIPKEDMATIFDEFGQAKGPITSGRGGAGLGLAVCKQFVQLHGGRISVESELGMGSTFRFTIPLPGAGKTRSLLTYYSPDDWQAPVPDNPLDKAVVLIAPDEVSARLAARGIEGYRVIPLTGLQALPAVVDSEHPAGVILVREPLSADQEPKLEDIWEIVGRPDLGVIEWEMPVHSLVKRRLQVQGYLTKPVEPEQLIGAIYSCNAQADRVLVVDDDAGFRALMERVISDTFPWAAIRSCATGEDALSLLEESGFGLIILDLVMPVLDGIGFLSRSREKGLLADAKVIVTTGAPYMEELAALLGTRLHFSKQSLPRGAEWSRCIKALLDSAPPDYSLPAHGSTSKAALRQ